MFQNGLDIQSNLKEDSVVQVSGKKLSLLLLCKADTCWSSQVFLFKQCNCLSNIVACNKMGAKLQTAVSLLLQPCSASFVFI